MRSAISKLFYGSNRTTCVSFYAVVIAAMADMMTSFGPHEGNPFMRDESHVFILSHGLAIQGLYLIAIALFMWMLYRAGSAVDPRLGCMLAQAFACYWVWHKTFVAVLPNILYWTGWYTL